MFELKRTVLNDFCVAVLFVYAWLVSQNGCVDGRPPRTIYVHNPRIDIVLLYDQSGSMANFKSERIWSDMEDWIRHYYEKNNSETRFAVMGCGSTEETNGDTTPILKLNSLGDETKDKAGEIIAAQKKVQNDVTGADYWDNVDGCVRSTMEKVLVEDAGDRTDAENVVFYITDCNMWQNSETHKKYMADIQKIAKFLFVCATNESGAVYYVGANLVEWVKNESLMIFNHTDKPALFKRLDQILDDNKVPKLVWDCDYETSTTPCEMNKKNECVKFEYSTIIKEAGPEDAVGIYVNACSLVVPVNGTLFPCEAEQCEMETPTTVLFVSTESGTTKLTGESPTKDPHGAGGATDHSGSTGVVIGVIVGLILLLVLIVIAVVLIVVRRKRKKKAVVRKGQRIAMESKTGEKDRGISADIFGRSMISGKSTMLKSTSKSDADAKKSTTTTPKGPRKNPTLKNPPEGKGAKSKATTKAAKK